VSCFREDAEGTLWFNDRIVVPKKNELRMKILDEAHISKYSIHPDSTKMYQDLREQFLWTRMKCETAHYKLECDTYRKVEADYMKPGGLLQPLSIPGWKWDDISMDFIVGIHLTARKVNSIWVIVDRFTKYAQFIPMHTRYNTKRYEELYIAHILCLEGVPKTIVSNWGSQFVTRF
jgi:hypothetical protein